MCVPRAHVHIPVRPPWDVVTDPGGSWSGRPGWGWKGGVLMCSECFYCLFTHTERKSRGKDDLEGEPAETGASTLVSRTPEQGRRGPVHLWGEVSAEPRRRPASAQRRRFFSRSCQTRKDVAAGNNNTLGLHLSPLGVRSAGPSLSA